MYNDYVNRSNSSNVIYKPSNSWNSNIYSIVEHSTRLTPNSTLGELISRIQNTLKDATNNSVYCSDSKQTNLRIAHITETGQIVDAAHIDLVFIAARGSYHNAMGYYYYPSNQTLTADEIKALPKFMVFPRTTTSKPSKPIKARIQFFGDDYNQDGTDHFPPGYTIGWVLIPNLGEGISFSSSANINTVNNSINSTYNKRAIYSDREANLNQNYGCVTLADKLSERIVIGFEDQAYTASCGDKSYEDILFYVECDPVAAIFDPERPEISDKPDVTEVLRTQPQRSTLAYEDIWPSGGDYDMNDVVVELTNSITFNQNNLIKRIETSVKAAHCGATLGNAFGIVVNGTVGDVVEEESNIFIKEESNQFIFFSTIMESVGETYTLVRTFGDNGIAKLTYDDTYNPFIVISYTPGMKSRKEVHLPKTQPTSWIDQSLLGQGRDMYFMDIEGKYPFAIELFDVKNWEVVTEKSRIGSDGEYPGFNKWVESFGETNADWYLHKN